MIEPTEVLKHLAQDASARLRVRSALNPLLWLCGIVSPTCFAFGLYFTGAIQIWLVLAGIVPILFTCFVASYFTVKKPEKLQSEDYQLRKQALELIQQKGTRFSIEAASVEAIANPQLPALPGHAEEGQQ